VGPSYQIGHRGAKRWRRIIHIGLDRIDQLHNVADHFQKAGYWISAVAAKTTRRKKIFRQ
jgi:hypothetical protein